MLSFEFFAIYIRAGVISTEVGIDEVISDNHPRLLPSNTPLVQPPLIKPLTLCSLLSHGVLEKRSYYYQLVDKNAPQSNKTVKRKCILNWIIIRNFFLMLLEGYLLK